MLQWRRWWHHEHIVIQWRRWWRHECIPHVIIHHVIIHPQLGLHPRLPIPPAIVHKQTKLFPVIITASSKSDPASIGDRLSVARAISKSKQFTQPNMNMNGSSLVDRWIELARENERIPGQIDTLLKQLGDIPEEHTERAS